MSSRCHVVLTRLIGIFLAVDWVHRSEDIGSGRGYRDTLKRNVPGFIIASRHGFHDIWV
jgi:hypothetical protein